MPFDGVSLVDHRSVLGELARSGYSDVWTSETDGTDGFTPLALAAAWEPGLRLGVAIAPAYTRGPALLAQTAASMAEAAPGRFVLGLGTSSDVIVRRWNGIEFAEPYRRARDTLRFLRRALAGERVSERYDTFEVQGFRLSRPPEQVPPLYLAALRPGMLRLAGREADGVIINWLSAGDVATVVPEVGEGTPVVARIIVCPTEDAELARSIGRRMIAAYLNVEVYAEFHRWLGRGPALAAMWSAWGTGDRAGALAAIPDEVVDDLLVHGSYASCRAHLRRYVDNGVTVPVVALVPAGGDLLDQVRGLAPSGEDG